MYTHETLTNQKELNQFLEMLSPSLESEVKRYIFGLTIRETNVFTGADPNLIEFVIQNVTANIFLPEAMIISQGDYGETMYFLSKGNVHVFINNTYHSTLNSGAVFGVFQI